MTRLAAGIFLIALVLQLGSVLAIESKTAVIYKNEACGHCAPYLEQLMPLLLKEGYQPEIRDFINSQQARAEMAEIQDRFSVPLQYRGHMLVFLDGKYLLEGHLPIKTVGELLTNPPGQQVILYQDSMGAATTYFIVTGENAIEKSVSEPFSLSLSGLAPSPNDMAGMLNNPWFLPGMLMLVTIALIAKYGF
ncbi:MAG: hypothetical protein AABX01_05260 [Candidatus Micrarchaeota archaeon]